MLKHFEEFANLLATPNLQDLTCIRMAQKALQRGEHVEALCRLLSELDKIRSSSSELYQFASAPKVYLDDERTTPKGWFRCMWPSEVITLLEAHSNIEAISLDHDLGDDQRGTGYDVILWIEEQVHTKNIRVPKLTVHSANSSAREKMEAGIKSIEKYTNV